LTIFEKDYTSTDRQASLAFKSIVAQMINSILTPVITAYYIKTDTGVYQSGGLVDNIFMMAFTNALLPPILLFFDPFNLLTKLVRCIKSRTSTSTPTQIAN
jgi:large-conductance mechanosensitive channel